MAAWVPKVAIWLGELSNLWFVLALLAAAAVFTFLGFDCLEQGIRVVGWLLQIVGFTLILLGLNALRKLFGRRGPISFGSDWWSRRPWRKRVSHTSAQGIVTGSDFFGRARATVGAVPGASLEQRVEVLEGKIAALYNEAGDLQQRIDEAVNLANAALERERAIREQADADLRQQMETAIADGLNREFVGVMIFLAGITASSISPELAAALGREASCAPISPGLSPAWRLW